MDSGNVNAIISAASGLAGVGAGAFLGYLKDRRAERMSDLRDGSFLAILVVAHLDRFVNGCVHVASDDGTSEGRPSAEDGSHWPTATLPKFVPLEIEVEWKALPRALMSEILQIPDKQEKLENHIANVSEFDDPPDYRIYFVARRRGYADLGLQVSAISDRLRGFGRVPIHKEPPGSWDRDVALKEVLERMDGEAAAYTARFS